MGLTRVSLPRRFAMREPRISRWPDDRDIAAIDDYCFAGGPTLSFVQKVLARLGLETDA